MHVETLAKLTHTLDTRPNQPPDWVAQIGASTLVIVDEAGMADTLTLDQVIHHAATCGATTRLIGDDQQLSAIGAGGILRDIKHRHGALHLDELMRFTNPDEANATLQLRDGDRAGLEFYLHHDRVHVGDELTTPNDVLTAWHHDKTRGLDALMLAPTRDQVRALNQHAQQLLNPDTTGTAESATRLADGLEGRVGDVIITRTNDRRLRLSATDWVTNGDRWTIKNIGADGSLDVTQQHTGLHARLPATYVAASVELGYATTTHTAQGVTADTTHGLITSTDGAMTRQDLYTMLTRGRHENHAYLPAAATTGDPHQLIHPDAIHPHTAREVLEQILDRDGAARSATTELESVNDPTVLLQHARDRYDDALAVACEDVIGTTAVQAISEHAEHLVPGITDQPAWPTLRRQLITLAADNTNPHDTLDHAAARGRLHDTLDHAAARGRLHDTHDPAATISWRIANLDGPDATGQLPALVSQHPGWKTYLGQRQLVVATHRAAALAPVHEQSAIADHTETVVPHRIPPKQRPPKTSPPVPTAPHR